jgi:hypothetical protein
VDAGVRGRFERHTLTPQLTPQEFKLDEC